MLPWLKRSSRAIAALLVRRFVVSFFFMHWFTEHQVRLAITTETHFANLHNTFL
jgi:hypothetical protein